MKARPAHFSIMPGTLAYIDTYDAGLVPCVVLSTESPTQCTVKVTARRKAWHRGEIHTASVTSATGTVVPRSAVYVKDGKYRIAGNPVICYPAPGATF